MIDKIFAWITSLPNATQGFIAVGFVTVLVFVIYIAIEIDFYIRRGQNNSIKRTKYPAPPVPPKERYR